VPLSSRSCWLCAAWCVCRPRCPPREGNLIWPLLLDHVAPDMRIAWEEPFGPVLPSMRVTRVDEAVAHCNSSNLGLQGCVFTRHAGRAAHQRRHADRDGAGGGAGMRKGALSEGQGPPVIQSDECRAWLWQLDVQILIKLSSLMPSAPALWFEIASVAVVLTWLPIRPPCPPFTALAAQHQTAAAGLGCPAARLLSLSLLLHDLPGECCSRPWAGLLPRLQGQRIGSQGIKTAWH